MSFQLFSKYALLELKRKGFNFIHFGLVQVGVQPLTKNGLNASIIACIRDRRHNKFKDSLLGLVETTSLCNGPIYFNCFPNFSVSLSDPHTVKVLTLDLQTNGCYYEGDIAVVYRIYYKAMNTVAPYCKYSVNHGTTTLFQTNLNTSSIVTGVPKSIRWDDVTPPESWILELDQIRESSPESSQAIFTTRDDGSVTVRFIRNSQAIFTPPGHTTSSSSLTSSSSSDAKDKGLKSRVIESSSSGIFTQNVYEVETPESAGTTTPHVTSVDTIQLIQY